ncbi:MAG: hypothetical protein ACP6IP_07065 [Candidatus Njordarchaeia archaeon]
MAAPLFLKILLFFFSGDFPLDAFLVQLILLVEAFYCPGNFTDFWVRVLIIIVGTLYLPHVERYFRENNTYVFFYSRRRLILYGLILNVVILTENLMPVFKFIFGINTKRRQ